MEVFMGVVKDEDCITKKDGSLICWDREENCILLFNKKKATAADVSKEELIELIALVGKPKENI
jgi:hypothetical protein